MAGDFAMPPYKKPPEAPVLYIKTRNCLASGSGDVALDAGLAQVEIAATLGLLFGRAATNTSREAALDCVSGACLALDISEPEASYYRPTVRQRCRDGFLPLGNFSPFNPKFLSASIDTSVNGALTHAWSLERLARDAATAIADISGFMTLAAGDLLLIGLPHDAPRAGAGDRVDVTCPGLSPLAIRFKSARAA
jgi:5-oxopent-3-ene-1,2,5-tricarboxylate decarboxylase/2-hydroxyhepta-2,4-diene-1,7-dioate isomerase